MFNISEEKYIKFWRELKVKTEENEINKFKDSIEFSFKVF